MIAGVEAAHRHARHTLHAGGHDHVGVAVPDGPRSHVHRLERAGTEAIDGHAAGRGGDAGQSGDRPRQVEALLALGKGAAENDVLDERRVESGHALQRPAHGHGCQVVRPYLLQAPFVRTAKGGAHGAHNHCIGHVGLLSSG